MCTIIAADARSYMAKWTGEESAADTPQTTDEAIVTAHALLDVDTSRLNAMDAWEVHDALAMALVDLNDYIVPANPDDDATWVSRKLLARITELADRLA